MFVSTHYAGKEVTMAFQDGETYKKVFGPVFVYLNTDSKDNDKLSLWTDAVQQVPVNCYPLTLPNTSLDCLCL
jgi:rhamnogalacturonan endolyase